MYKLSNLEDILNNRFSGPFFVLAVRDISARETKTGSLYLAGTLSDGTHSCEFRQWSISESLSKEVSGSIIKFIKANNFRVNDYGGKLQLVLNNGFEVLDSSQINMEDILETPKIKDYMNRIYEATKLINDKVISEIILNETIYDSRFKACVGGKVVHHSGIGDLLVHTYEVSRISLGIYKALANQQKVDLEILLAGALLHDVGKKFEYDIELPAYVDMSPDFFLYGHAYMGAQVVDRYIKPTNGSQTNTKLNLIKHIILSHHGKQEFGAVVVPKTIEAHIVHHADILSALSNQLENDISPDTSLFTSRLLMNGNQPMLKPNKYEELDLLSSNEESGLKW